MALELYDTLQEKVIPFTLSEPGKAKIYVCGPTTYDDAHIGHARPCIVYDVLVRYLRSQGIEVTYVRNVTDIDDKIIKRAAENHETPTELAERMFDSYSRDMERLGNLTPDSQPKVSEHLGEIVALIAELVERGYAYPSSGDVYFEVSKYPAYGRLSHRNLRDLEAGASERVDEVEQQRKRHAADFALWKGAKPGEPSWPSPWGPGRPGWHIECSAMSMKELGPTLDLHGGGLDLVFPHHENEIAQSECATGCVYSHHWMHNGFVQVNREKMSKSLGNFFRLREAFDKVEPEAVRYSLLAVQYRAPYQLEMELDDAGRLVAFPQFRDAENRLVYLYETKRRLAEVSETLVDEAGTSDASPEISAFSAALSSALDSDLNTAVALGHVAALLKAVNELLDRLKVKKAKVSRLSLESADAALRLVSDVLGLGQEAPLPFLCRVRDRRAAERGILPAWVEEQLVLRKQARDARDFAAADAVRGALVQLGVEILDSPSGTTWRLG
jgi:cysteinyl-tRNA synthetase